MRIVLTFVQPFLSVSGKKPYLELLSIIRAARTGTTLPPLPARRWLSEQFRKTLCVNISQGTSDLIALFDEEFSQVQSILPTNTTYECVRSVVIDHNQSVSCF